MQEKKNNWRFRLGGGLFFLGFIFPAFIPLVLMIDMPASWKTVATGMMAVGLPDLLWIVAASVLGKQGFIAIKEKAFHYLKKIGPPDRVSQTRYTIGLFMFFLPLLLGWLGPYISLFFNSYESNRLILVISGDLLFVSSFFILGGNFWDKLQALFIHDAKVVSPIEK